MRYNRAALIWAILVVPMWAEAAPMQFVDDAAASGITFVQSQAVRKFSSGAVAEDFDNDGWVDLYVVQGDELLPSHLYMNQGDGTFTEEAADRGAQLFVNGLGPAAADYDNDGDVDLCVSTNDGFHPLLINDGAATFTIQTNQVTQPLTDRTTSVSWGDVDNDGQLELLLGTWQIAGGATNLFMYYNRGGGQLENYEFRVDPSLKEQWIFSPRFADVNNDRRSDLLVVADFTNSQLFHNVGGGKFENLTAISGASLDMHGMGNAVGDYDNDGDLDWFVTTINRDRDENHLYRNLGDGLFEDVSLGAGVFAQDVWGWAASFGDLDLDGDLDIIHTGGWNLPGELMLFDNQGDGTFVEVAQVSGLSETVEGRGLLLADLDNDGDLDVFISDVGAPPLLFRNVTATTNHWLKVQLAGKGALHRHGIGSRVYITAGGVTQMRELHASTNYMSQDPGRIAHFGTGVNTKATEVRAEWVNGDAVILPDVPTDQAIEITSPGALVSKRLAVVGQSVAASGARILAPGETGEWEVEGQMFADPFSMSFATPGEKELIWRIFDSGGSTLLRTEILRIQVIVPPVVVNRAASWTDYP